MTKKTTTILLAAALFSGVFMHAQDVTFPANVPGVLAWFKTVQDVDTPTIGYWRDFGPNNVQLVPSTNGMVLDTYRNVVYSVNYNPGLYFDTIASHYQFRTKKSFARHHSVIAVIVPEQRDVNRDEWVLFTDDQILVTLLATDSVHYLFNSSINHGNYGTFVSPNPSDLRFENENDPDDEIDRHGKVVTTEVLVRPDQCHSLEEIRHRLLQVYSVSERENVVQQSGIVPEFIVFDHILPEEERIRVESYLSTKYGMSKHYDYTESPTYWMVNEDNDDCDRDIYLNRITGIGSALPYLNQSRSTSYYDETAFGRFDTFSFETDYSQNRDRLISISIEDESSDINTRWNGDAYFVWGDDDTPLGLSSMNTPFSDYERLDRTWKTQYTASTIVPDSPAVSWCNFINMKNDEGIFSRAFEEKDEADRDGVFASSTPIPESAGGGSFEIKFEELLNNDDTSYIGFSRDNHHFTSPNIFEEQKAEDCRHFSYALGIAGNKVVRVYWDTDDDGIVDQESGLSIPLDFLSTLKLEVDYTLDGYDFETNFSFHNHTQEVEYSDTIPLYAKFIVAGDNLDFQVQNAAGFEPQPVGRTNVELSYDRVEEFFPGAGVDASTVYLVIDRTGTGDFDDPNNVDFYPGVHSRTPNGAFDKLEWIGVEWTEGGCDVYTFAQLECDDWTLGDTTQIDDCCGLGAWMPISILGCHFTECLKVYYRPLNDDVIDSICVEINDTIAQYIYLENGDWSFFIDAPGDAEDLGFTVSVNSQTEIPQDLIPDSLCFQNLGDTIQVNANVHLREYDVTYRWEFDNSPISSDSVLILQEGMDLEGEYIVQATITCIDSLDPEITCVVSDTIEICNDFGNRPCKLEIVNGPCNSIYIKILDLNSSCNVVYTLFDEDTSAIESNTVIEDEILIMGQQAGGYFITIASDGCCDIDLEPFIIPPMIEFDIIGDFDCICPGDPCLTLDASANLPDLILGTCTVTYEWKFNSNTIGNTATQTLCSLGIYEVIVSISGCPIGCTETQFIDIACDQNDCLKEDEVVDRSCPDDIFTDSVFYIANDEYFELNLPEEFQDADKITWTQEGKNISFSERVKLQPGFYKVEWKSGECQLSDYLEVKSIFPNGLSEGSQLIDISYTNPVDKFTEYNFTVDLELPQKLDLYIYSSEGKLYQHMNKDAYRFHEFEVSLPAGLYYLRFVTEQKQETIKIISQ